MQRGEVVDFQSRDSYMYRKLVIGLNWISSLSAGFDPEAVILIEGGGWEQQNYITVSVISLLFFMRTSILSCLSVWEYKVLKSWILSRDHRIRCKGGEKYVEKCIYSIIYYRSVSHLNALTLNWATFILNFVNVFHILEAHSYEKDGRDPEDAL